MKTMLLPVAVMSMGAIPAVAETFPSGFSYSGEVAYESTKAASSTLKITTADIRLGYGLALDNGLKVGVTTRYRSVDYDVPVLGQ